MLDLYNEKYSRETLKQYIYSINLLDVLKTQTIDASFAVKYILNNTYQLTKCEESITDELVMKYQPHITKIQLMNARLIYDSEDDSIDDFETVSRK
jgi:hypothetical protein